MTLTEFRYIVAVARKRHFGRAAGLCHVSQPTLSMGVKRLEEELGVVLFERSKSEVTITPAGEGIVAQAQRVLEEAERIKLMARHGEDPLSGPLRLGVIQTVAPYILPHLVGELHEQAPRMPLIIDEDLCTNLSEKLKNGQLDVILITLPFREPHISTWAVYEEPFVVLTPVDHPLHERERICIEELASQDLIVLGPGHCFREQVLGIWPKTGQGAIDAAHPTTVLEGGSLDGIRHMVASGLGVAILPCSAARSERHGRKLLSVHRFSDPVPKRRVALAWRTSFHRRTAVATLHDAIQRGRLGGVDMLVLPINA